MHIGVAFENHHFEREFCNNDPSQGEKCDEGNSKCVAKNSIEGEEFTLLVELQSKTLTFKKGGQVTGEPISLTSLKDEEIQKLRPFVQLSQQGDSLEVVW